MIERQELIERKAGSFKMLAFLEEGELLSQRPLPRCRPARRFIGMEEEAEQRKWGASQAGDSWALMSGEKQQQQHVSQSLVCSEVKLSRTLM